MTRFLLVRHADHDFVGKTLVGRRPGVHLNERGRLQAEALPARLLGQPIDLLCCSPLERAVETAAPLAWDRGLEPRICEALTELDFGEWTGSALEDLRGQEAWRQFHAARSCVRIPGGESMREVQTRVVDWMERIRLEASGGVVAMVSHGDVLRSALAWFLAVPLDLAWRFEVSPASFSIVDLSPWGPAVHCLNRL